MKKFIVPGVFILSILFCCALVYGGILYTLSYSKKTIVKEREFDKSLSEAREYIGREPDRNTRYFERLTIHTTYYKDGWSIKSESDTVGGWHSKVLN